MTKGTTLAPDWRPSGDEIQYGRDLGMTEGWILNCAEDFKIWALSNANRAVARKANWHLAFLGWMRREASKRGMLRERQQLSYQDIAEGLRNGNGNCEPPDLFAARDES